MHYNFSFNVLVMYQNSGQKYSPIYITFVEIDSTRSSGFAQSKGPPMAQSQFGNQNNLFGSTLQPQ